MSASPRGSIEKPGDLIRIEMCTGVTHTGPTQKRYAIYIVYN